VEIRLLLLLNRVLLFEVCFRLRGRAEVVRFDLRLGGFDHGLQLAHAQVLPQVRDRRRALADLALDLGDRLARLLERTSQLRELGLERL
jgi:hypothetical protein